MFPAKYKFLAQRVPDEVCRRNAPNDTCRAHLGNTLSRKTGVPGIPPEWLRATHSPPPGAEGPGAVGARLDQIGEALRPARRSARVTTPSERPPASSPTSLIQGPPPARAGRLDDVGDLDGLPGTAIQVCAWADALRAVREKPLDAERQSARACGATFAATMVRPPRRRLAGRDDPGAVRHVGPGSDVSEEGVCP